MASGIAELQILLRARDEASKVLQNAGNVSGKAGKFMRDNWKQATLALGAAGAGIEALSRSQADNTKIVQRLAAQTGLQAKQIRGLAIDTANVTFPLDEVLKLMETGVQRGLEGGEALEEYAKFWDLVGDATGLAGPELGKAGVALEAVGIAAGNEKEALAAFGFITENTTSSVKDFLGFIDKAGPDLRDLGLGINETAAILGVMEKELGLAGRTARTEFIQAVQSADGSLEAALATLGLTSEQVAEYTAKVSESSGVIERNAKITAESFTPIQKMQNKLSELAFAHADVIKQAASLAPILIAAGPIMGVAGAAMTAMSAASGIASAAFTAMGIAARIAWAAITGPIGIAIVAIIALVAAGVLIWKNWETIKAKAVAIFNFINDLFHSKWAWLLPGGPLIKAIFFFKDNWRKVWDSVKDTTKRVWDAIVSIAKGGMNVYIGIFNKIIDIWNALEFKVPAIGFGPLKTKAFTIGTPDIPRIPSLEHGGIVPGRPGQAVPIIAHGGEVFSGVSSSGRPLMGSRTLMVNFDFSGATILGVDDLEDTITETVRNAILSGGFEGVLVPA